MPKQSNECLIEAHSRFMLTAAAKRYDKWTIANAKPPRPVQLGELQEQIAAVRDTSRACTAPRVPPRRLRRKTRPVAQARLTRLEVLRKCGLTPETFAAWVDEYRQHRVQRRSDGDDDDTDDPRNDQSE